MNLRIRHVEIVDDKTPEHTAPTVLRVPHSGEKSTSENKQLHLFLIKCCKMGKGGVLWGRLVMKNQSIHNVIHRRNRTIYRRKAANLYSNGDATCFCCGSRDQHRLRFARPQRINLALARGHIRIQGKHYRAILVAGRGRNGSRASLIFPIKTTRNRQAGTNSIARDVTDTCRNIAPSGDSWSAGSPGSSRCRAMGSCEGRESLETSRNNDSSSKKQGAYMMKFVVHQQTQISIPEQGRSGRKGACVRDDACTLLEIYAARAARYEPRMACLRESASTDARY